jgi:hypothetical protein
VNHPVEKNKKNKKKILTLDLSSDTLFEGELCQMVQRKRRNRKKMMSNKEEITIIVNKPMLLGEQSRKVCLLSETWRIPYISSNLEDHKCHPIQFINHRDQKNQKKMKEV